MSDEILYEVVERVAWVTVNRPEKRNALNAAARSALFDAFRSADADPEVRVVVVTGAGDRAFCAGADLSEMAATGTGVPGKDFTPILRKNVPMRKPTIAAVNGLAYAGGFLLAQMCDLCVAADHARFAISEAKVGRGAPWAAPLTRMLPQRILLELLVTAAPMEATRLHELGMVNAVVPAADLRATVAALAATIVRNAPLTVEASITMVRLAAEMGVTAAEEAADAVFAPVYRSADAQEGPRAFRERRDPVWTGS